MICPHCKKPIHARKISKKEKDEIIKLRKQGYSLRDIEKITEVSFSSAGRIIREWEEQQ